MKLINDFAIALVQPKKYKELLSNSTGRVAIYVIILLVISSISLVISSIKLYGILGTYYADNIPDFKFENDTLEVSQKFDLELAGMKIMLDTDNQLSSDEFSSNVDGFLCDKDSMIVKSRSEIVEIKYSDLTQGQDVKFDKVSLYQYKDVAKLVLAISAVFAIILSAGFFMLGALVVAGLVCLITSALPKQRAGLQFSSIYKLALYSRALPVILSVILSRFIGGVPLIISMMISVLILNSAILRIATDDSINNKGGRY